MVSKNSTNLSKKLFRIFRKISIFKKANRSLVRFDNIRNSQLAPMLIDTKKLGKKINKIFRKFNKKINKIFRRFNTKKIS